MTHAAWGDSPYVFLARGNDVGSDRCISGTLVVAAVTYARKLTYIDGVEEAAILKESLRMIGLIIPTDDKLVLGVRH